MQLDRQKHWQFLEDELRAQTEVFEQKFNAEARSLLTEFEEMFVGQFLSFKDGVMVMKFPNSRNLPRKGEHLFCMVLPKDLRNYRNWGSKTYRDLFNERFKGTECACVWIAKSDDPRFSLVGFRKVELEFADFLVDNNAQGTILVFAPQRLPIDYIANLQRLVNDRNSLAVASVLDADYVHRKWSAVPIRNKGVASFVRKQLALSDTMILQGPPGTGKTYMIAQLCEMLCAEGKSVLVTALTNRALMEIAEKPSLRQMLSVGKIMKTNMTSDESNELPKLEPIKHIVPTPGSLVLSTYYIASGFAAELGSDSPFDFVIMDEASQALTAMFAAAKKIGKTNLWVGDTKQLSPIVALNEDRIRDFGYAEMVDGLGLLSEASANPIYQLTTTYRYGQRAADYTGLFYNGTLVSNESPSVAFPEGIERIVSRRGGPALVLTDMGISDYTPKFAIQMATYIVGCIIKESPKKNVAVLTCMIRTVKALQKSIIQTVGAHKNVFVETIARVQGLTTDVTVLVIPNVSYIRTLEPHLFNVATSRAKEHTIIIADKDIMGYSTMDAEVRSFIEKLSREQMVYVPARLDAKMLTDSGLGLLS